MLTSEKAGVHARLLTYDVVYHFSHQKETTRPLCASTRVGMNHDVADGLFAKQSNLSWKDICLVGFQ